ncbi:aminopeptidase domain protein [Leptospira interrogans serovar Icterohaemorrhagiae str. Verdun HP]|uniref:Aminopeptidase domain protein n=1 Tax=Leptospira interrogans serovar Icterohaemorrhagiae str. Verdun HP TaxID=1049910 RepID=M6R7F2_LEPIR|nr:aminopeptidase domain protein [Leptospira interrogans serovar Icterohaemorrhagiae str. Verdun HP]
MLYDSDLNDERKLEDKKRVLEEFKNSLLVSKKEFKTIRIEKLASKNWNNEDFVGYLRYHSGSSFFIKNLTKQIVIFQSFRKG